MGKLISFIIPSRNLANLATQFDHFEKTTANLDAIEFLIKLDSDHAGAKEFIENEIKKRKFTIKYILTPRLEGTFSLWIGIEQLFAMVSNESYFIQVMSDEPYFITQNWDEILRKYIHFFKDDVFRFRLSSVKYANYASHYECAFRCDSFPIYTKRWLELTEGIGDCWGSDAYQQSVAYHLSLGPRSYFNFHRENSYWRDIPLNDLQMGGLEFGVGVDSDAQRERHFRNLKEWHRLSTYKMQERFSYLARRLYCAIWAYDHDIDSYILARDVKNKIIRIIDSEGNERFNVSYKIQRPIVFFQNLVRDVLSLYYIKSSPYLSKKFKYLHDNVQSFRSFKRNVVNKVVNIIYSIINIIFKLIKVVRSLLATIKNLLVFFIKAIIKPFKFILGKKTKSALSQYQLTGKRFTNIISSSVNYIKNLYPNKKSKANSISNEIVQFNPPGIDVLYKSNYRLPPGVKPPTQDDISNGTLIITFLNKTKIQFRNKTFKSQLKCENLKISS